MANCQFCSYANFCGLCNTNYILTFNSQTSQSSCLQLNCTIPNCVNCYQNNVCSACNSGFYLSTNGQCLNGTAPNTCTAGCLACNSTACSICKFGYNLQNGACFFNNGNGTTVANCQSAFDPINCQLCNTGYVVSPSYQCITAPTFNCQVANCAICSTSANSCQTCQIGFYPNGAACTALQCSINNCLTCTDASNCQTCIDGYQISNNTCMPKYYPCAIQNCIYCKSPNVCGQCAPGFSVSLQVQQQNGVTVGSSCVQITSSVGGVTSVTNCQTFGPMIPGTSDLTIGCITCNQNYINVGGYCVANITQVNYQCNIANCVYCIQNNICGQCATNYTSYIAAGSYCVLNYSPIPNCLLTPFTVAGGSPTCSLCANGYALVSGIVNGNSVNTCVKIPASGVTCNITGCNYCIQDNVCFACISGYSKSNNTCSGCSVQNCAICSNNLNCQTCQVGYYLSTNNTCLSTGNQPTSYCTKFGNCSACNYYACTQCATSG